ncbi:MAG: divergent polysaccharide deacetylase family protein [Spirochaetaceae bacterium]|jgi:polysaccharide deacetylase 2 family uncharacterized protein YibQ|nr:divergent polysaccharide deacetylase family protein [Spirochaetaceae bacterium]
MNRGHRIRLFFGAGLGVFLTLLIVAGVVFIRGTPPSPPETSPPAPAEPLAKPPPPEPPPPEQVYEKTEKKLIFVIDDAGNNLHDLEPFLRFPGPITIAVLPGLRYSAESAQRIRSAGKAVLLHQPMEAVGGQDPGPGAIYAGMTPEAVRTVLEKNLAEIGPVAGMNNHQGSKATMDPAVMETVLTVCREQGIYFLDSRTIAETAAPAVAERLGMNIAERDIFLDNIQEKTAMLRYLEEGLEKADRRGIAIMIGHTWSPELAPLLAEAYADLTAKGYAFSTLPSLD